nr:AmmeMemoRadiSam system protein A [Candidatus Anammoximicrobium sp.]
HEEACGKLPVLTLMHLAIQKGWKTRLLDIRNSGAATGDCSNVVGYAAVAFFEGDGPSEYERASAQKLTQEDQKFLLDLARKSLNKAVRDQEQLEVPAAEVPDRLRERGACFVTLTKKEDLRGCIGHIFACRPLYQSVLENAKHAALEDRRFSPVEAKELDQIAVEVSVLTTPRRVEYKSPDELIAKLRPGVDGVVFGLRGERSTYLPQVWEQLPDKEQFLRQLVLKAGLRASAWKDPEAAFLTYQVQAFKEAKK